MGDRSRLITSTKILQIFRKLFIEIMITSSLGIHAMWEYCTGYERAGKPHRLITFLCVLQSKAMMEHYS